MLLCHPMSIWFQHEMPLARRSLLLIHTYPTSHLSPAATAAQSSDLLRSSENVTSDAQTCPPPIPVESSWLLQLVQCSLQGWALLASTSIQMIQMVAFCFFGVDDIALKTYSNFQDADTDEQTLWFSLQLRSGQRISNQSPAPCTMHLSKPPFFNLIPPCPSQNTSRSRNSPSKLRHSMMDTTSTTVVARQFSSNDTETWWPLSTHSRCTDIKWPQRWKSVGRGAPKTKETKTCTLNQL